MGTVFHIPTKFSYLLFKITLFFVTELLKYGPVLPFARKFPCKRKFWPLQGNVQGNKIYKEMVRNFVVTKEMRKILRYL